MKRTKQRVLQWRNAWHNFRKSPGWLLAKFSFYATAFFLAGVLLLTYLGILVNSIRRRRRAFKFPHRPLDPVEVSGHTLKIFNYGGYAFRDMLLAIDDAQESIYLETYILKSDEIGREFKKRIIARAEAGVKVYIAFDGFGSLLMPLGFRRWPKSVCVSVYGPLYSFLSFLWLGTYVRDHRKILVIDDKTAYVGGMNIGREYSVTWRDTHLRIDGPKAQEIALAFSELWNKRNRHPSRRLELPFEVTGGDIQVAGSRPSIYFGESTIRDIYLEAFKTARRRILITNPYFLPDKDMEQALVEAIHRGVRLEIIVPEKSNHSIVDLLARPVYQRLLESGAFIWLYQHTVIHSKTAAIDGAWGTIGSANLDGRSLINHEINVFVNSAAFAAKLEEMFLDDRDNCRLARLEDVASPPPSRRLMEALAAPIRNYV